MADATAHAASPPSSSPQSPRVSPIGDKRGSVAPVSELFPEVPSAKSVQSTGSIELITSPSEWAERTKQLIGRESWHGSHGTHCSLTRLDLLNLSRRYSDGRPV